MPYLVRKYLEAAEDVNFLIHIKTYIQLKFVDIANNSVSSNLCPVPLCQMAVNVNRKSSTIYF